MDEIFKGHLFIKHSTILPLFNDHVVEKSAWTANCIISSSVADLEYFLFNKELVVETILHHILLDLTLKDEIKHSFLRLVSRHFENELSLVLDWIYSPPKCIDDLKYMGI